MDDHDPVESRFLEVEGDLLPRSLDDGVVRSMHPMEIVIEEDDLKVLLSRCP